MASSAPQKRTSVRRSGLDIIGKVAWGTHFCQFYQDKDDLLDILVPYFKAGLEDNEFCMWVTADPLGAREALEALGEAVPDLNQRLDAGQLLVLPHDEWYLQDGHFDHQRVLDGWVDKLNAALRKGYDGLRVTGNTAWLQKSDWRDFVEYEEAINGILGGYRMIALCTYALDRCGASEVIDVVKNHEFALIRREGQWELIESSNRRLAQQALRRSETKYRIVADNTYDWEMWLDPGGKFLYSSPSCERITGHTAAEFEADADLLYGVIHPDDLERFIAHHREVEGGMAPGEMEFRIVRRDGTTRWIEHRCQPVYDDEGRFLGSRGSNHDITERRQAEETLRRTRDFLENLLNYANAPIIVWDPTFRITQFNRAFERLTGYSADEVIGQELHILFPESSRQESLKEIHRTLTGEYWESVEIPILRKNGGVRLALWNSANVYATDGKTLLATIAQGQDITERKMAEETLRRTRDLLEKLVNYANAPIIVWDPEFRITQFNRAFERLTGYSADEVIGRELAILFPEASRGESLKEINRTLSGEYWESVEIPILRKDGGIRLALWNSANIYDEDGKTLLVTIAQGQDITERKLVEEELRRQTRELQAANQELESFSYSVSHDLRAPLRAMDGFSRILLRDYEPQLPEEAKRYLRLVRENARQMGRLIDDLLNFSRLNRQPVKRQLVLPRVVVQQVVDDLGHEQEGRRVEIVVGDLPMVSADPMLLRQVYTNLLSNALKFTRRREVAKIEVGYRREGEEEMYYVKDNGVGFDMRYVDKLFGVFQRLHRAEEYEGTGVGLAIVQRILHRHGGRIWAEAEVDRGATFYFTIGRPSLARGNSQL